MATLAKASAETVRADDGSPRATNRPKAKRPKQVTDREIQEAVEDYIATRYNLSQFTL